MDGWTISYNIVCWVGPSLSHGFVIPKFQKGTFFGGQLVSKIPLQKKKMGQKMDEKNDGIRGGDA